MGRLALLIANDSFLDARLNPLVAPREDARALRDLLLDEEIGGFDDAEILINESKPEIERRVEAIFNRAGAEDLVCLYFSGHGLRDDQGDLHFAVTNTERDLLHATAVSARFLLGRMDGTDAAAVIVLLDCCYSGAFAKGFKTGAPELRDSLPVGRGRYVLTASNQIEMARDGEVGDDGNVKHSAFTGILVQGLTTGEADVDGNGRVTPEDLWSYVSRRMRDKAPRQTPTKFGEVSEETHLARVKTGLHTAFATGIRVHLGDLLGRRSQTSDRGYRAEEWGGTGRYVVPIGQSIVKGVRSDRLVLNVNQAHLLVVGRLGCGKSTLLRTLAGALCLTHTPDEARLIFMESGGARLGSLRRLPHVTSFATNRDETTLLELLSRLEKLIEQRQDLFVRHYTATVSEFRDARNHWDASHPDYPHPDVFVFVDRWGDFANDIPGFAERIAALASAGLDVGVHIVVSARAWEEVPRNLDALVAKRIEFALPDAETSRIDERVAAELTTERSGWAHMREGRFRVALPDLSSAIDEPEEHLAETLSDGAAELVEHVLRSNENSGVPGWTPWRLLDNGATADYTPVRASSPTPGPVSHSGTAHVTSSEPATPGNPLLTSPRLENLLRLRNLSGLDLSVLRGSRGHKPIPIGLDASGEKITISPVRPNPDAPKPHTLLVGGVDSGKNELLRTIITGAAAKYTASDLNLALFSFRGTTDRYRSLAELPHVVAQCERLRDLTPHAERYAKLLDGELRRRSEVLREHGNIDFAAYGEARLRGEHTGDRLPALLVVIDEFGELFSAVPRFAEVVTEVCRIGERLGVHVLLSARRVEAADVAGFNQFLHHRIALRTTAAESRLVIGGPEAAELPTTPGAGFLRRGDGLAIRFSAATTFHDYGDGETMAARLCEVAGELESRTDRVWPEPLTRRPALTELLPPLVESERGLAVSDSGSEKSLVVPIGLIDNTDLAASNILRARFDHIHEGPSANLLIAGTAASGKFSLAATTTMALSLTRTPEDLHFYIVDLTGNKYLDQLRKLPHVGGFATADKPHKVRRTIHELHSRLARRGDGETARPKIVLVFFGWDRVRDEFPELTRPLDEILENGQLHDIHVIAVSNQTIGTPTTDPSSIWVGILGQHREAVPKQLATVTATGICHGVLPDGREFIGAVIDEGLPDRIAAAWHGDKAPPIPTLPDVVPVDSLPPKPEPGGLAVPIGLAEDTLEPVYFDFSETPHLVVSGQTGSGSTSFLVTLTHLLTRQIPRDRLDIAIVDRARVLMDAVGSRYEYVRASSTDGGPDDALEQLTRRLRRRREGFPEEDRRTELFLIIDGYGIDPATEQLTDSLREFVPEHWSTGLHLVISHQALPRGSATARPDSVLSTLAGTPLAHLKFVGTNNAQSTGVPPGRAQLIAPDSTTRTVQTAYYASKSPPAR